MIQLDTGFLILAFARGSREDVALRGWLGDGTGLAMSTIAWGEFLCGPVASHHVALACRIVTERIEFSEQEAELTAVLFDQSGRRRGSLVDCMIAATAVCAGAPLATANPADFDGFAAAGLELLPI